MYAFSGNEDLNRVINIFLGNPNFIGSLIACFLDNTIPGMFSLLLKDLKQYSHKSFSQFIFKQSE